MAYLATKNMKKYAPEFHCKKCDYKCSKKYLWDQHCATQKHNRQRQATPPEITENFVCDVCFKTYKQRSGLWRHRKKCFPNDSETHSMPQFHGFEKGENSLTSFMQKMLMDFDKDAKMKDELFDQLKQQNKIIQDMIPRLGNNNNNKFNINLFLNENCREAINMTDFINSLSIQIEDLQFTKNNGLIEGVSSIFLNGLKQLDTYKRPIHCTDMKRETLYIKDNNEWERDIGKHKLKEAISDVATKQRKAITEWEESNPAWFATETGKDEYIKLIRSVMADVNGLPNENKIIKSIAKETIVHKEITGEL
jgi:hypothetical protein|tara:strand:- start:49 stop:972 length:924 start_codon:yes stop_codon:yes gene_type:complete